MERIIFLLAMFFTASSAFAYRSPAAADECIYKIVTNDPRTAPSLYAGVMYFNNTGFKGATRTYTGLGADIKYRKDKWRVHTAYTQGLFDRMSSDASHSFMRLEGDIIYYTRSAETSEEMSVRMKGHNGSQVITMPAQVFNRLGIKAGYSYTGMPLDAIVKGNAGNMRITMAASHVVSAGLAWTRSYNMEISSAELGDKHVCPVRTWYADVLYAPVNDATFYSTNAAENDAGASGLKWSRAGARIGYEWTSISRWRNTGAMYGIEAGYRPGISSCSDGMYIKFNAGLSLDW